MVIPMQAASVNTSPAQARANEQLRNDIQNTIREAQTAAREAARSAQAEARSGGPVIRLGGSGSGGGVIVSPPDADFTRGMPPQIVDISVAFFVMCAVIAIGWPLARAFGKRIERKGEAGATNPQLGEQLQRIERAVDAMSIEVERISEAQRFVAKLQSAQRASLHGEGGGVT